MSSQSCSCSSSSCNCCPSDYIVVNINTPCCQGSCCGGGDQQDGCAVEKTMGLPSGDKGLLDSRTTTSTCPMPSSGSEGSASSSGEECQCSASGGAPTMGKKSSDDEIPSSDECTLVFRCNSDGEMEPVGDNDFELVTDGNGGFDVVGPEGEEYSFDEDGGFKEKRDPDGEVTEYSEIGEVDGQPHLSQTQMRKYGGDENVSVFDDVTYTWDNSNAKPRIVSAEHSRTIDENEPESLSRLNYAYYEAGDDRGNEGQLESVTSQVYEPDTQQWKDVKTAMYRYDTETGRLKYAVHPGDFEKLANDAAVSDPHQASDAILANYADTRYEYDSQGRVSKRVIHGGRRTHLFSYAKSEHPQEVNHWTYKFQEELPSGDLKIRYSNYARQPISEIVRRGNDTWIDFYQYDASGRQVFHASPSAVIGINEESPTLTEFDGSKFHLLRDHEGKIELTSYGEDSRKVIRRALQHGQLGDEITLAEYEYVANTAGARSVYFLGKETLYNSETDEADVSVTRYTYEFHDGTPVVKQRVTHLPIVPVQQNGTGTEDTITEVFSESGKQIWRRDQRGLIQHSVYDCVQGQICQRIDDADVSQLTGVPAGWQTPAEGGKHLVTDFEYDSMGRNIQTLGPVHDAMVDGVEQSVRTAHWTLRDDSTQTTMTAAGFAHGTSFAQFTLVNPVRLIVRNAGDHVTEEIAAVRQNTNGKLSVNDSFAQSSYVRWTKHRYTECCFRDSTRVYFKIPVSGEGTKDVHYNETLFAFDRNKNQYRSVSPRGLITHSVFDPRGRLISTHTGTDDTGATEMDPTGAGAAANDMVLMSQNVYDHGLPGGDGHLTEAIVHVDENATRSTRYVHDWRGRSVVTDGELTEYSITQYDNRDRVVLAEQRHTDAAGILLSRSENLIDAQGRVYRRIQHGVDPQTGTLTGDVLVSEVTYDAAGNTTSTLAPGASVPVRSEYDSVGRNVRTIDQMGFITSRSYNGAGQVITQTDAMGNTEVLHYDAIGRQVSRTNAVGDVQAFAYNDAGQQNLSIDGLGHIATSTFDNAGRDVAQTTPDGETTTFAYDADGNRVLVTDPLSQTISTEFDLYGRQTKVTDPTGDATHTVYNRIGEAVQMIDAKGMSTLQSFDSRGRTIRSIDRLGGVTSFEFDARGNQSALTDAENQTTSYTFDQFNRLSQTIFPDHTFGSTPGDSDYGIVTTEYDSQSRVHRKTDQLGDTVTFVYDDAGRLLQRDYRTKSQSPTGAIADSDTFTYDASGNILTASSGRYGNSVAMSYDSAGRMASQSLTIDGQTYTVTNQYDARGLISGYTYPDGKQVSQTYTPTGALKTLHFDGNLIDTRVYDGLGRLTRSTFGNGVVTDHSYRADNRLASIQMNDGNGNSMDSFAYSWDANKNLTHETRTGVMSGYGFTAGYDAEDRLTSWNRSDTGSNQSWNLSPVGDWNSVQENGQTQSRHHGPTHELLSVSQQGTPQAVSHDAKGNMTVIPSSLRPDALELTLAWDFDNRMHTAANDNTIVSQRFDALGRRVGRDDGTNNQVFVQINQQTVADYASGASPSSPTYTYVYGSYIDEPVMRSGSSGDRYYHRNQQYSITALTDGGGAIKERYAYTAYGGLSVFDGAGVSRTVSAEGNRYSYTGREWDSEIGLYHYRARMYDPMSGRFCSRDPIGYEDGLSLFEYVGSSPVDFVDPSGFCKEGWVGPNCVNYNIWIRGNYFAESDQFNKKWWWNRGDYFSGTVTIVATFNNSVRCCCPEKVVPININSTTYLDVRAQLTTRLTQGKTIIWSLFGPLWVKAIMWSSSGLDIAGNLKRAAEIRDKAGNLVELSPAGICPSGIGAVNVSTTQRFRVRKGPSPGFRDTRSVKKISLNYSGKTCDGE